MLAPTSLQAFSTAQPTDTVRPPVQPARVQASPAQRGGTQALPATPPTKPLPRGSLLNLTV